MPTVLNSRGHYTTAGANFFALDAHHPGEWQLPKSELLAAFQLSKRSVERAEWAFGCINHGFQDEAVGEVSLGLFPGLQGCFENGGGLNI
jgi:hypothetical protein